MLLVIYLIVGYWATGKTVYANKVVIYSGNTLFLHRLTVGCLFGWVLIPLAILRVLFRI